MLGGQLRRSERQSLRNGLLFSLPWIIGLLAFYVYPIGASFYYSLTSYNILNPPQWAGLGNYVALVTVDDAFRISALNSLAFAMMAIPSDIVVGIVISLLLNTRVKGMGIYRALYYLPVLVPEVAAAVVWKWVLHPRSGIVNAILGGLGLPQPGWLGDPVWAKPSLVLVSVWGVGNAVVIYLAALQDVPRELLDAAAVDGANVLQRIHHVSLPMITPVIFFNLIMGVIGSFQVFTVPFLLTDGSGAPAQSLLFYAMQLYRNAFQYLEMGRAAAMAWMLLVAVALATTAIFSTSARWVYYGGEARR